MENTPGKQALKIEMEKEQEITWANLHTNAAQENVAQRGQAALEAVPLLQIFNH